MLWLQVFLALLHLGIVVSAQNCSFQDESTGYSVSWSAGTGFVDFFFNFKKFPILSPQWTGIGFGENETLQVALIENQFDKVIVSSAEMQTGQPPLKLSNSNMVTRGYGSIDEERLRASFSVPIYFFNDCKNWTFFTKPTQAGMSYNGNPQTQTICNISESCVASKTSRSFRAYSDQTSTPTSLNIQIPNEVSRFLEQPVDADFDIKGGIHLSQNPNGANIRFSPQQNSQNQYTYDQQYGYTSNQFGKPQYDQSIYGQQNGQNQFGQQQFGQQQFGQSGQNPYGQNQFGQMGQNPYYPQNQFANSDPQSMNAFTVENPNYKFLPDNLNLQYEANSGRQRFYDNNGNPIANNQYGVGNDQILSNADQNRLNYQEISRQGTSGQMQSGQYTNNIYGYDYRTNPGSKYTINGNEQQYQPPQNQRYTNGRRKKRQTGGFQGTAYQGQDAKFPRVENTIPTSTFDEPTPNFNTDTTNFNPQRAYYDSQNLQGGMYYPYQTNIAGMTNADYQRRYYQSQFNGNAGGNTNGFGTYTTNNRYDPTAQVGPLTPYYINGNGERSNSINRERINNNDGRQLDTNPYSTNKYNPVSPFYNRTQSSDSQMFFNDNTRFNSATHQDVHQYDDPNCQGPDPPFCKDYVKHFQEWFKSYQGSGQSQGFCSSLRQSLFHTDHHCCQALQTVNCL